jgi:SAM-dependent methyltransferase
MEWNTGYVTDVGYTFGYYHELNPLRVNLAFLNAGLTPPTVGNACELGFGQGVSTNLHAAASLCSWHGTDFQPSQAGFSQELANISGAKANLFDDSFEEFYRRELPDFDYIGLHGIWSWISNENRQIIIDFIRRKLKVGGVVYISYNTLPGWGTFSPMRHLLTEHAKIMSAEGDGIVNRIDGALEFTEKFLELNPLFAQANPLVIEKLKHLKNQNRNYLAHEYFNRDWHPMHFSTMSKLMESAKLNFACSANYLEHIDTVNLTKNQQTFLKSIPDPIFKQTVRDFMCNQQFRKDYWVKGDRKLNSLEQTEAIRKQRFILTKIKSEILLKVTGSLGEAQLNEQIYVPIIEVMSDFKIRTFAQIEQLLKENSVNFRQLLQCILVVLTP